MVAPGGVAPDQDRPPVGADCTRAEEERRQYGDEDSGSRRQQWGGGEGEGGDHQVHRVGDQQTSKQRVGERGEEGRERQVEEEPGPGNQGFTFSVQMTVKRALLCFCYI